MTTIKLLKPLSTDAGEYGGMKNVNWGCDIQGTLTGKDNKTIMIKGSEFIRVGGSVDAFTPEVDYMWAVGKQ